MERGGPSGRVREDYRSATAAAGAAVASTGISSLILGASPAAAATSFVPADRELHLLQRVGQVGAAAGWRRAGGQVHGTWPGLAESDLVDGDLNGLNDYRQVLAEILEKRCGTGSLSQIFPGISPDRLGVVRPR